jgi:uncharacterized protein YcnI
MRKAALTSAILGLAAIASAHVTVSPRESKAGTTQRYLVRVPTEGKVATVSVDLEIPSDVEITEVSAPAGAKHEAKRQAGRINAITWTIEIKPGDMAELPFTATNPSSGASISWKAHQHFADGTTTDWTAAPGQPKPAARTTLTSADPKQ